MATLAHNTATTASTSIFANWLATYRSFIARMEFYRVGWAAGAIIIQGNILTPALLLTMFYYGGPDWQLLVGNLSFLLVLVPILSAMPVKYIVPTFAFSFVVHLSLILMNVL